jgi:hypothetical protein
MFFHAETTAMKLFVYGSLLNPDSAERALQRRLRPGQFTPATLPGYQMAWNSIQRIHTAATGKITSAFLNLVAAPGDAAPGCLLDIDDGEFARLCQREQGYTPHQLDCRDAAGKTIPARVFIDQRPPPHPLPPVLASYLAKIEAGLATLPAPFAAAWRAALPPPPLPLLEGDYRFVDPAQRANT